MRGVRKKVGGVTVRLAPQRLVGQTRAGSRPARGEVVRHHHHHLIGFEFIRIQVARLPPSLGACVVWCGAAGTLNHQDDSVPQAGPAAEPADPAPVCRRQSNPSLVSLAAPAQPDPTIRVATQLESPRTIRVSQGASGELEASPGKPATARAVHTPPGSSCTPPAAD